MATDNVNQPGNRATRAGSLEPQFTAALRAAALVGIDTLPRARALLDLVSWIYRARDTGNELRLVAEAAPELYREILQKGLKLNFPEWEYDEAAGLQWLLLHIGCDLLGEVEQELENALKASHTG
jgi:hypothetical protein